MLKTNDLKAIIKNHCLINSSADFKGDIDRVRAFQRQIKSLFKMDANGKRIEPVYLSTQSLGEAMLGPDWKNQVQMFAGQNFMRDSERNSGDNSVMANAGEWTTSMLPAYFATIESAVQSKVEDGFKKASTPILDKIEAGEKIVPDPKEISIGYGYRYRRGTQLAQEDIIIPELGAYPTTSKGSYRYYFKKPNKRGCIIDVSMEAIRGDTLNLLLEADGEAANIGYAQRMIKERLVIRLLFGLATQLIAGTHSTSVFYEELTANSGSQSYLFYYGTAPYTNGWVNKIGSAELLDKSDLDAVMHLFEGMVDPISGESLDLPTPPLDIVVTSYDKASLADEILKTYERWYEALSGTDITAPWTATNQQRISRSTFTESMFTNVIRSYEAFKLLTAETSPVVVTPEKVWLAGKINEAVALVEAEPPAFFYGNQSPTEHDHFRRDIAFSVKYLDWYNFCVKDPRKMVYCQAPAL